MIHATQLKEKNMGTDKPAVFSETDNNNKDRGDFRER